MSCPVQDTPKLIDRLICGEADYVTGRSVSETKSAMNYPNKPGNWMISWITRLLLKIPLRDSQTGMFAFRFATALVGAHSWEVTASMGTRYNPIETLSRMTTTK
jgi:hypothetical protein